MQQYLGPSAAEPPPLYFDWAVSALFGWGVYGLNLLRLWPEVAGAPAYPVGALHLDGLAGLDPLTLRAIAGPLVEADRRRRERVAGAMFDGTVLHALGNALQGSLSPRFGGPRGTFNAGVVFFEDTALPDVVTMTDAYDCMVAGSTWCHDVLRARGVRRVVKMIQGVDLSLFHPGPRAGTLAGRFAVFSGGKLERRKGQDLVLRAFRIFGARHEDAVLVTAWHSPWPVAALTLNDGTLAPATLDAHGRLDPAVWAAANGVAAEQFIDLGVIPNHSLARVLREMDVAVFPNRCEGGTNLVAMECMACGVPAIVADNTGQRDLVATGTVMPLTEQRPVRIDGIGTEGWGESSVEEIVAALEHAYQNRGDANRRGAAGAAAMAGWSWRRQFEGLAAALADIQANAAAS